MIGIIDCHSPEVIMEMESLISKKEISMSIQMVDLVFGDLTVIPGSELEIYDEQCQRTDSSALLFPNDDNYEEFSNWLSGHLKNIQLSSQRIYATGRELQKKVKELEGYLSRLMCLLPLKVFTEKELTNH